MPRPRLQTLLLSALLLPAAAAVHAAEFASADFDTTCSPCRDFHQYANGGWLSRAVVPPSESSIGSFQMLAEQNRERSVALLRGMTGRTDGRTRGEQLLVDHWGACMDSAQAERAGLAPLQPLLSGLADIVDARTLARQLGWLHAHAQFAGFSATPGPDARNSERVILSIGPGALGLPDRDYYLNPDSASVAMRAAYGDHIVRSMRLAAWPDPEGAARRIAELESAFAEASLTNVQRRDPRATYHKVPFDTLRAWTMGFDWDAYAAGRQMKLPDSVNVTQPRHARAFARAVTQTAPDAWREYLRWRVLDVSAPMLSEAFALNDFEFRRLQSGQREQQPRWKRCLRLVDQDLGDALGQAFVAVHFPASSRRKAQALVDDVQAALDERIGELEWMSEPTRVEARAKLAAMKDFIGYPDRFRDYAGVRLRPSDLVGNRLALARHELERQMARIGGPPALDEWRMSAPTVNAFYMGSANSINFPAGILQPPFFSPDWDDATNLGAIGAVIGHEITHGFDDRGRQFDARGNLRDWWQQPDAEAYRARAQRVVEQYDAYTVAPGVHVNGRLTLGENIADLGGLAIAYAALQRAYSRQPRTIIQGFTPEQRFFLAYARVWRRKVRPEALVTQVRTDSHAPGLFRTNGPLTNLEEFARAFGCAERDPMVRPAGQRTRIW